MRRPLTPLLLVLTSISAAAQGPGEEPQGPGGPDHEGSVPEVDRLDWPLTGPLDTFGDCEAARLIPHHGRSVLFEWGSTLALAYAPGIHELILPIATGVTAFAVCPADGASELDTAVVANAGGLSELRYRADLDPPVFEETTLPQSSSFANAVALACADLDGDGDVDVAAADASGLSVRTLLSDGAGGYAAGPSFTQANPIRDLEALEWVAGSYAGSELAVLSTWGTEVYTIAGERLWWRFSTWPDHVMTRLGPPDATPDAPDRLVVVQWNNPGTNQLLVVHDATGSEAAIALTDLGAVGLDAGDFDGDGDEDVAVSHRKGHFVRVFENRSGQGFNKTFGKNAYNDVNTGDPGVAAPLNLADPCLADLDDDAAGQAELVIGAHEPEWIVVSNGVAKSSTCPQVFADYVVHLGDDLEGKYGSLVEDGMVGVEIELQNVWGALGPNDRIELFVWRQLSNQPSSLLSPLYAHAVYLVPASAGFATQAGPIRVGFTIENPKVGTSVVEFLDKYYFEVRVGDYSSGSITNPGRTYVGGLTGQLGSTTYLGSSLQHLETLPGAFGACTIDPEENTNVSTSGGGPPPNNPVPGGYVGGLVPQLRLPKLPSTSFPYVPAPVEVEAVIPFPS